MSVLNQQNKPNLFLMQDKLVWLFACLFVFRGFSSHSRIYQSFGDVTIAGGGLQNLTHTRHSCPLSSEGSLACHAYCDREHPFIMVISENP